MFKDNENGRQEANVVPSQQFDASKRKVVQYNYVTSKIHPTLLEFSVETKITFLNALTKLLDI